MMRGCYGLLLTAWMALVFADAHKVLDFMTDFGAVPDSESEATCALNSQLLAQVLNHNASGNTIRIPNRTFHLHHGVYAKHVNNSVIQIDGTLRFERMDIPYTWKPLPCLEIDRSHNLTLTSSGQGLVDGQGSQYWGIPLVGYLELGEDRPRLMRFNLTSDLLIENLVLKDSPYHTLYLEAVNGVEIRHISIVARRTSHDGHGWVDLTAFNTDGIDVSGHNVHVHDVDIWVQDDCIAVKDNYLGNVHASSNMTFERIHASGLGFVVGSIGGSTVRNITFRDSYLHKSVKGIYLKFNHPNLFWRQRNLTGLIENVSFENITMEAPLQWPIWIGPAQQADTINPCHPNPCSLCWPMTPASQCHVVHKSQFRDITLQNVRINNPQMAPGVILANHENEMTDILFDEVRVTHGGPVPQAQEELAKMFPGLKQPIHDAYVPKFLDKDWSGVFVGPSYILTVFLEDSFQTNVAMPFWVALIIVLCLILSITWTLRAAYRYFWGRVNTSDDEDESSLGSSLENDGSSYVATEGLEAPLLASRSSRTRGLSARRRCRRYQVILGLAMTTLLAYFLARPYLPMIRPKWQRTSRYYACRGVVNGVAKGKTWPVPYCFEDQTDSARWYHPFAN